MKKQALNPFLPSYEYIADGEPHIFGDRLYLIGSHDAFDGAAYCINDYVAWSAPVSDLSDWSCEGIIYRKEQDPLNPDGTRLMFAPDVAQGADGRFYLFYTLDLAGEVGAMSVAVCDTPAGQYEYYGAVHYPNGTILGLSDGELLNFDPGIFVDDDGRVFLYTGIAPPNIGGLRKKIEQINRIADGGYVVELEPDMLTVKSGPRRLLVGVEEAGGTEYQGHAFFEASSMRKIDGQYYFIYSSENSHELCYAVSSKPDEDFHYGGTLISIGDVFLEGRSREQALNYLGNTHGSIEMINGSYYIFYHRQTNLNQFSRQACAERLSFENGQFRQAEITSCGLNNGPLPGTGEFEARIVCNLCSGAGVFAYSMIKPEDTSHPYLTQSGPDREKEGDQYIANMRDGSLAGFKYFDFQTQKPQTIKVMIRGHAHGVLHIGVSANEPYLAHIEVTPEKEWHTAAAAIAMPETSKPQALYFTYTGTGSIDFKNFTLE